MAFQVNNALLRGLADCFGYPRPSTGRLHLYALRHCAIIGHPGEGVWCSIAKGDRVDAYDSTLGAFGTEFTAARGATEPGLSQSLHPQNAKGAAYVEPGMCTYRLGFHKKRRAVVQDGAVRVRRDTERKGYVTKDNPIVLDAQGVNCHAGGVSDSVGPHSAGCLVWWGGWAGEPWREFYRVVKASGQERFALYLFDADQVGLYLRGAGKGGR